MTQTVMKIFSTCLKIVNLVKGNLYFSLATKFVSIEISFDGKVSRN